MSGGGKRFNIWIAYSDLFSNLSTFLFISAVGILAIMGSGSLKAPEVPGSQQCRFAGSLLPTVEHPPSLWQTYVPVAGIPGRAGDCAEYVRVEQFRFEPGQPSLAAFKNANGRPATANDLQRICVPLWQMLVDKDFNALHGRMSIIGVSDPDPGAGTMHCGNRPATKRKDRGFPDKMSAERTIDECRSNPAAFVGTANGGKVDCAKILNCFKSSHDNRDDTCQDIVAIDLNDKMFLANCRKEPATEQALAIYQACQRAPLGRDFPSRIFAGRQVSVDGSPLDPSRPDDRSILWLRNATFEGVAPEAPAGDKMGNPALAKTVYASMNGSVLVEFRYSP